MPDINGIPYVDSDDLVSAYPAVSQSLAQEVSDRFASLTSGKILQVIYGSTTTEVSTTSTSFVDSGLSATITPSQATSKVLVLVSQQSYAFRLSSAALGRIQIVRDTTAILTGANEQFGIYEAGSTDLSIRGMIAMNYLDSPSTTSATTYKTQQAANSGHTLVTQKSSNPSTMILLEVSA